MPLALPRQAAVWRQRGATRGHRLGRRVLRRVCAGGRGRGDQGQALHRQWQRVRASGSRSAVPVLSLCTALQLRLCRPLFPTSLLCLTPDPLPTTRSNVALHCAGKLVEEGAVVLTLSDSKGYVFEPEGFTPDQLDQVRLLRGGGGTACPCLLAGCACMLACLPLVPLSRPHPSRRHPSHTCPHCPRSSSSRPGTTAAWPTTAQTRAATWRGGAPGRLRRTSTWPSPAPPRRGCSGAVGGAVGHQL